jgi:hypothetical protein
MKVPFESTLSEQDAVFSVYVQAETRVNDCVANFFNGDMQAEAKMRAAQCRSESARKAWLAFCLERYSKPAGQPG